MNYCVMVMEYLRLITLSDLVDIVILSFILYKCINLLQWTNAAKVAKVLLIMVACMWVSYQLSLDAINFLLSKAMELGFLALVILFQPEIRRFLEQMGRSSISKVFAQQEQQDSLDSAIQQTVEAYASLSKSKTGALMVFERKNMLEDAIKTGTTLDCSVSAELLKNLFWNKAPLHDGAVIVRSGRIVGAGCMLPMSGNVNISRELGMRHRAGIGASEQSDGVVAIVSEETGSISVAVGGMLKRHLSPETLERILRNELMPQEQEDEEPRFKLSALLRGRKGEKADVEEDNRK